VGNGGDDRVGDGESEVRFKKKNASPNEDGRMSTTRE
jgi:hypothetical protein